MTLKVNPTTIATEVISQAQPSHEPVTQRQASTESSTTINPAPHLRATVAARLMPLIPHINISSQTTVENITKICSEAETAWGAIKNQNFPQLAPLNADLDLTRKLLVTDDEGKFKPRNTGLFAALRHFSDTLKASQATLFKACDQAADELLKQRPFATIPQQVYCIAAHQSEEHLVNLIDRIAGQSITKHNASVFIFLNGDNPAQKLEELKEKAKQHPNLDLRIISASIPKGSWRMGLKSLGTNIAMLTLSKALQGKEHADITLAFGDADILRYSSPDHLMNQIQQISSGGLIHEGPYKDDFPSLFLSHINIGIAGMFWKALGAVCDSQPQIKKDEVSKHPPSYVLVGGNSACSMILAALTGGVPAHPLYFEDVAIGNATKELLKGSHQIETHQQFIDRGAGPSVEAATANYIVTDGGALIRTMQRNLPVTQAFGSHDPKLNGKLTPLDFNEQTVLNEQRLVEDVAAMLEQQLVRTSISQITDHKALWGKEAEQKLTAFLEKYCQELHKTCSEIQSKLGLNLEVKIYYREINDSNTTPVIKVEINSKTAETNIQAQTPELEKMLAAKASQHPSATH